MHKGQVNIPPMLGDQKTTDFFLMQSGSPLYKFISEVAGH